MPRGLYFLFRPSISGRSYCYLALHFPCLSTLLGAAYDELYPGGQMCLQSQMNSYSLR